MSVFLQKTLGVLTNWAGDGPWRAKSVLAAVAVVAVGLWFWFSDVKNSPPQVETNPAMTNASIVTSANPTVASTGSHWNWSRPFPFHVRMGLSYVAGFCIGWFFRKLTKLIFVVGALIIVLLGYGKLAGCDTTHTQEQVKRGSEWAQHETKAAEDYLKHLLPSATAGGAGVFLGFRRRSKTTATATPEPVR